MDDQNRRNTDDVRMRGFARRQSVESAIAWLDAQLRPLDPEPVPLPMAARRVLAESITSNVDVPGFDRATMDGYALAAESTEGATSYNRLPLTVIGDSLPGRPFPHHVGAGQAVRIMTGAPMPQGCDAVLPAEFVDSAEATSTLEASHYRARAPRVFAVAAVSPGKHVGRLGEDVTQGTAVLPLGRWLRPQDLGVLSSIGVEQVHVYRRPRVRLVVTGNELLPAGSRPHGHCIVDANGPMLAALVERDGGLVDFPSLVPDEHDAILDSLYTEVDVVIVSGGSSVGVEDLAPTLLASHESHATGIAAEINRCKVGVARDDAYIIRINSEHFGDDISKNRIGTLTNFRRSAKDGYEAAAIEFQLHAGLRHLVEVDWSLGSGHDRLRGHQHRWIGN